MKQKNWRKTRKKGVKMDISRHINLIRNHGYKGKIKLKMKEKVLTITIDSRGGVITEWGDGVTAEDVLTMCEYAEGEAQYVLEDQEQGSDEE